MGWPFKKQGEQMPNEEGKKSEMDTLLEKFSAVVDAKLAPVTASVDEMKGKWNKMEEEAQNSIREEESRRAAEANNNLSDEEKRANREQALFLMAAQAKAGLTERDCVDELRESYPQLVPSFKDMLAKTDPKVKALPNYPDLCRHAMDQLIGKAAREGGLRYNKKAERFVLEDANANANHDDNPLITGDLDWTDERSGKSLSAKQQLSKMKLSEADFKKMQEMGMIQ